MLSAPALANEQQDQLKTRISQLTQELNFLHQKALSNSSELAKQKAEYDALIKNTIKSMGHDADALEARLKEIAAKGKNKLNKMTVEEQKALQAEFIEKRNTLTQAFLDATNKSEVKAASEKLNKSLSNAIIKLNPESKKLVDELQKLQAEFQRLNK